MHYAGVLVLGLNVFLFLGKYYVYGTNEALTPGIYRVLGAEGDASLTAINDPIHYLNLPQDISQISKVKMVFWSSLKEQEWKIVQKNNTMNFFVLNEAKENNVLSVSQNGNSYREWKISKVDNGQWQIKDVATNKCLSRLGVTVYHEGSDCDGQVQPQHWRFTPLS